MNGFKFEPKNLLLNLELNQRFGSGKTFEPNSQFSSRSFGFEPEFRTELSHHTNPNAVAKYPKEVIEQDYN